jgi:hypothetical protein
MRHRILLAALMLSAGCSWLTPDKKNQALPGASPDGPITLRQLEGEVQDLADRFAMGVAEAVERLKKQASEDERRRLHLFKLRNAESAYDVVTGGDPLEGLLDLLTLIELQNIVWIDEGRIARQAGRPGSEYLATTLGAARKQGWALAARALPKNQLTKVRAAIQDWRKANPDVQSMSFVRFSSGTGSTGLSTLNEIRSGLGSLLNPFTSTTESVDQTRELAAKALYYAKRLPMLMEWEAEAAAEGVAVLPEFSRLSRSVADLPAEGRSLIVTACAGLAGVVLLTFVLLAVYRRLSFGWERKLTPAPQRPPTRLRPQT